MRSTWKWTCFLATVICSIGCTLAGRAAPLEAPCFAIRVRLNGKEIDGPQKVILKTLHKETKASQEQGCFKMPAAFLTEHKLGISFTVSGNRIDIPAIATGFYTGTWDVQLEDKRFRYRYGLPKHFRDRQGCVVVFHMGDEPERHLAVMPCRTPIPVANGGGS